MSGTKAYPEYFQLAINDISGGVCEVPGCKSNKNCQTHHIFPRSIGKTIHKIWNCIKLCEKHHTPGNWEKKMEFLKIHLQNVINYCRTWDKKPNKDWTRLINGKMVQEDLEEAYRQMIEEGLEK